MENYTPSPAVKQTLSQLKALPCIAKALDFLKEDTAPTLKQQIELAKIPAPTYHEKEKALAFCEALKAEGLEDVHLDRFGNAIGLRRGKGAARVIMEAHMDTVFPLGTKLEPRIEGSRVYLPGVNDDTSGLGSILTVIRALNAAGIETEADLYFMGTVEEEGMGGLGGMKKHMSENSYDASISIDGSGFGTIVYGGTGIRTCEINFHSGSGHAAGAFGKVANSLNAAARCVAKIADLQVPPDSGTIFCVSNFHAGNDAGIHAIVGDSQIKINYRSHRQDYLVALHEQIMKAAQEACDEETARWGCETVTWDTVSYVDIPAVSQSADIPLVQALYTVIEDAGLTPKFAVGGATNCTMAINAGIPAVCIGSGGTGGGAHSLDEYYDDTDRHIASGATLLLLLMMAGVAGETAPLAEKKA